jgi:pyridoxamine 5'-phosphate oxidase
VNDDLAGLRRRYQARTLDAADLPPEPLTLFHDWFSAAREHGVVEPNAMALATVDGAGRPRVRHVLLKGVDPDGFAFYTNLSSQKAADIAANPAVSLCFPWFATERQVIVCGSAAPVSRGEAAEYWATRPRESQIGAWASRQSSVIGSRAELERRAAEIGARFAGTEVPLPEFWGGYVIRPESVEFWQGGPGRLHDRFRYTRSGDAWRLERLAP